jgi:hypothetical protein
LDQYRQAAIVLRTRRAHDAVGDFALKHQRT